MLLGFSFLGLFLLLSVPTVWVLRRVAHQNYAVGYTEAEADYRAAIIGSNPFVKLLPIAPEKEVEAQHKKIIENLVRFDNAVWSIMQELHEGLGKMNGQDAADVIQRLLDGDPSCYSDDLLQELLASLFAAYRSLPRGKGNALQDNWGTVAILPVKPRKSNGKLADKTVNSIVIIGAKYEPEVIQMPTKGGA